MKKKLSQFRFIQETEIYLQQVFKQTSLNTFFNCWKSFNCIPVSHNHSEIMVNLTQPAKTPWKRFNDS